MDKQKRILNYRNIKNNRKNKDRNNNRRNNAELIRKIKIQKQKNKRNLKNLRKNKSYRRAYARTQARLNDKKRRIRNKKSKYMIYYIFFTILIFSTAIILSLTVFFKIKKIEIKTSKLSKPGSTQILNVIDYIKNENLILVDSKKIITKLLNSFPTLNEVIVEKNFPNTLKISCQFEGISLLLENSNGELFGISKSGRVIKKIENKKQNMPLVLKIETKSFNQPQIGEFLTLPEKELQILASIQKSIKQNELNNITKIELNKNFEIKIIYDNRIEMEFKNISKINEQLKLNSKIVKDFVGAYEKGKLCFFEKNHTTHFIPESGIN